MIRSILTYSLHFLILVVLQLFVFNNIYLFEIVHPYIYVYFLLLLPINFSRTWVMILAFVLGLIIDLFSSTYGIHAASATLTAFIRPLLLGAFVSDEDTDALIEPHIKGFGLRAYLFYALALVSIHHLTLFMLEAFGFRAFGFTLLKILLTTSISLVFVFIYELFFFFKKSKKE
jgi:rod shape-determining protein MreD